MGWQHPGVRCFSAKGWNGWRWRASCFVAWEKDGKGEKVNRNHSKLNFAKWSNAKARSMLFTLGESWLACRSELSSNSRNSRSPSSRCGAMWGRRLRRLRRPWNRMKSKALQKVLIFLIFLIFLPTDSFRYFRYSTLLRADFNAMPWWQMWQLKPGFEELANNCPFLAFWRAWSPYPAGLIILSCGWCWLPSKTRKEWKRAIGIGKQLYYQGGVIGGLFALASMSQKTLSVVGDLGIDGSVRGTFLLSL